MASNCTLKVANVFGGGSHADGMLYGRGSKYDFDQWAKITTDPIWSYDNMLEYFKDYETIAPDIPSSSYRGTEGPWPVTTQAKDYYFQNMTNMFIEAAKELN